MVSEGIENRLDLMECIVCCVRELFHAWQSTMNFENNFYFVKWFVSLPNLTIVALSSFIVVIKPSLHSEYRPALNDSYSVKGLMEIIALADDLKILSFYSSFTNVHLNLNSTLLPWDNTILDIKQESKNGNLSCLKHIFILLKITVYMFSIYVSTHLLWIDSYNKAECCSAFYF